MAKQNLMQLFVAIIIVQLFYAFAITALAHYMPENSLNYVTGFSDVTEQIDLESVGTEIQGSVQDQLNIPVIELGALVYYSGNIIVDLLVNFFFAIPEMIGLLVNGLFMLFNLDNGIFAIVEIFTAALVGSLYFIGLIQLLGNIRSGRGLI